MTPLERALHDITSILDSLRVDYMVIGGIANAIWGEPRATIDVDVTVSVSDEDISGTVAAIGARLRIAVPDGVAFVRETRVLPVDTADGVRVDVIFALIPFELDAIARAKSVEVAGRMVRVVTPEDLILMKIISDRPRDLTDAESLVRRRLGEFDHDYLNPRVRELAAVLERPEIFERWKKWMKSG